LDTAVEAAVPIVLLLVAVGLAALLLTRQRSRLRPTDLEPEKEVLLKASRRQRRVLEKLDPLPEIPSIMDLMRQEIAETGVEEIPGHEGIPGPVMLKVFRRDQLTRERCTHDAFEFVIQDGIEPAAATEDNVRLFCEQCGEVDPGEEGEIDPGEEEVDAGEETGTESDSEAL
jgi:hypothetical protein